MKKMIFGRYDYAAFVLMTAYALASLTIPVVLVELAKELHFALDSGGMGPGGALQIGLSFPMVAAMLFCAYFAARHGLRRMLGFAALLMGTGILAAAFARCYGMLFAVLIAAGIGEGLIEGLATPLVQTLHRDNEPGRYINFTHGFWSVGIFVCVPLIGMLLAYGWSWRIPVAGAGCFALIPAALLLWPSGTRLRALEGTRRAGLQSSLRRMGAILRRGRFWLFFAAMFFAGGGEFCLTFWCATLLKMEFHASAFIGSTATALFSAGMLIGRTGTGMLIRQRHLARLVVAAGLAGAAITLLFPMARQVPAIMALLFLAGLSSAPFWPSIQSYCCDRMKELDSTMIFVLLSCAGVPGSGVATALLGVCGDRWGLREAIVVVPFCYLVMTGLIALDMRFPGKKTKKRAI